MDPRGANPLGSMPVAAIVQQSGNRYLTLTYHRLIGVTSIPYKVCVSDDLVTWDETEAQVETVGTPTPTGNGLTETVTVRLKNPISYGTTPRKFMRLNMGASSTTTTVFQDNFDDNSIDPAKWTTSGNTVIEAGGIMQVLETVIDQWGVLTSKAIPINPSGTITINRNVYLHDQTYSYGGGTHFFGADTGLQFGTLPPVVIRYFNLDYEAPPNYKAMHGFYICRNGAAPHNPNYAGYDPNDVSSWISPIWATWFKETIVYNPQTGNLAYSINDVLQTTFNVGIMPVTASPSLVLYFDPIGWWMGHEHLMDNLQITQESQSH